MYHMLAVERSKIGFSEADAGRNPESWISLEPFASTMCRSIYTCSSGLTRRSGCTRKASYVDTKQNHQRLHLDLDTQSHTDLLQSLLLLLSCSIQFRPICHAKPTKLPGLVFRFAVLAQPAWSGRTAVLTGHATSKTHEIPQLPCFLLSLTVLSKPITYWVLIVAVQPAQLRLKNLLCKHQALRYIAIRTPYTKPLKLWLRGFQQYLLPGH